MTGIRQVTDATVQNEKALKGIIPDTHLELLTQWREADAACEAHPNVHLVCGFVGQRWGCPDWRLLADVLHDVEIQMMDAGMPSPNSEIYQGPDGANLYYVDLVV